MCGIVGLVLPGGDRLGDIATAMADTLVHRGPDDSGLADLSADGVALGMRRLSVLDLEGGAQPMWDEAHQRAIVFNGEIYNHMQVRKELQSLGHVFQSDHSDTETVVHGYEAWGSDVFPRLDGMFAVAIWDRDRHELVLARDRAGEKPLYVAEIPGGHAFASELKAFLALPDFRPELDPVALEQVLAIGFVVGPRTILRRVQKLPAGHVAVLRQGHLSVEPYWRLPFHGRPVTEGAAASELDAALDVSVRDRMVADVPIGLFLSGGLDSSSIAWYMRRHSDRVRAFTIGFDDQAFDETAHARTVATHLGLEHDIEILSGARSLAIVEQVPDILDEPMADPSVLPTHLVSLMTRQHVTVALGGDGSDELLMGYRTYQALKLAAIFDVLPLGARRAAARLAERLPDRATTVAGRARRFGLGLEVPPEDRLLARLGPFIGSAKAVIAPDLRPDLPASALAEPRGTILAASAGAHGWADRTIAAYARGYLQEDILVKVDRASMAASLEVRAPFLAAGVIELLGTIPPSLKLRRLTRKHLLRVVMRGRIPAEIIDRPKQGFGVPLDAWFRGPLRPLVEDLLSPAAVGRVGWFDRDVVDALVQSHLAGRADHGVRLWALLQLELWRRRWLTGAAR